MKTEKQFHNAGDLKFKREAFVAQNQSEFDNAFEDTMIQVYIKNLTGPRRVSLTLSSIKGQRMSLHIAEYLQTQGYKISVDEKNSKVIIRW